MLYSLYANYVDETYADLQKCLPSEANGNGEEGKGGDIILQFLRRWKEDYERISFQTLRRCHLGHCQHQKASQTSAHPENI